MINLRLEILNPWSRDRFKNLGSVSGKITQNKSWELEHTFCDSVIFDIEFKFTTKQDHAGLELVFGILGYEVHFRICDNRHWDYENDRWAVYN